MKQLFNNLYVAGQITAENIPQFAEMGVSVIINNRPDGEESGQLTSEQAAEIARKHNIQYYYLPMINGQPLPPNLVEDFQHILQSNSDATIVAHCRSGMRSSFIWALGAIADGTVTVDEAVNAGQAAGIPLQNARPVLDSIR